MSVPHRRGIRQSPALARLSHHKCPESQVGRGVSFLRRPRARGNTHSRQRRFRPSLEGLPHCRSPAYAPLFINSRRNSSACLRSSMPFLLVSILSNMASTFFIKSALDRGLEGAPVLEFHRRVGCRHLDRLDAFAIARPFAGIKDYQFVLGQSLQHLCLRAGTGNDGKYLTSVGMWPKFSLHG